MSSVRNQGLPTGRGFIKCQRAVREQQGKWGGRGGLAPETKGKRHLRAPGDQPGGLQPGGNYRRLQWLVQVYFQLHRTERHRQRHVKKADNLVKKVAVCLTNRDQSDDKNMIGIGINI